ncbi:MAG: hypothetical protein WAL45_09060 [Terracidiphilus sp.]
MDLAILRKAWPAAASAAAVVLVVFRTAGAMGAPDNNQPKTAVLHATVSISGGVSFTGAYDDRLPVQTCAGVARGGTGQHDGLGKAMFYVPIPMQAPGGDPGPVGGGHNFSTDAAAGPYHGPGTYTGSGLVATQMDADTPPGSQDTHIFAFPTDIGTMVINPDASGSFKFGPLQDPGSILISGQVTWTCSEVRVGTN